MIKISKDLMTRVERHHELHRCVVDFIKNNGTNPKPGYLTDLTVFIRNLDLDEPEFFGWDDEVADDFYSWGHNSRYANVLEPMLYRDLEQHVEYLVDLLDDFEDS